MCSHPRKAQTSVEFVFLVGAMLIMFLLFSIMVQNQMLTAVERANQAKLREIENLIKSEFDIAFAASPGYSRVFEIPTILDGLNYSVELFEDQEIILTMQHEELVGFIPYNITGTLGEGKNVIWKNSTGGLFVNGTS